MVYLDLTHIPASTDQRRKYLPKLASGEWIGAYALTEPTRVPTRLQRRQEPSSPKMAATTS